MCDDGHAFTAQVGSFPPNNFGLHDMLGNVRQWVADDWHPDYRDAPADGSAWLEPRRTRFGVLRGGAYNSDIASVRSGARYGYPHTERLGNVGFRVARDLAP